MYVEDKEKMREFEMKLEAEKEDLKKKSELERMKIEQNAKLK